MVNLLKTPFLAVGAALLVPLLAVAQTNGYTGSQAPLSGQTPYQAMPGTVSYVEGHASIDGQPIGVGSLRSTRVAQGQTLTTGLDGKAEMLLTPGVVFRLGSNSAARLVSPSLNNTQVELQHGTAMVEVDQIAKENHIVVMDHGSNIVLERKGLYSFNADQPMVAVYDGKASTVLADKTKDVYKGEELMLQAGAKTHSFDRKQEGDLYAWSSLRSQYLAQANGNYLQNVASYGYPWGWYGAGYYWDPYFDSWAFLPGAGYLYSPFGFPFYSPVYFGGFWGGGYHGFYGRPGYAYGRYGGLHGFAGAPAARVGGFGGGFHGGFGGGFHGGFAGGRR